MDWKLIRKELTYIILKTMPMGRTANDILVLITKVNSSQRDLDRQVEEAFEALTASTGLISSLEKSLDERANQLNDLKDEYERISKLAELTEEQGKAIAKTLELTMGVGQRRERWVAFAINILAGLILFILGVFASDWVESTPEKISYWINEIQSGLSPSVSE